MTSPAAWFRAVTGLVMLAGAAAAWSQRPALERARERKAEALRLAEPAPATPFEAAGRTGADFAEPRSASVRFTNTGVSLTAAWKLEPLDDTPGSVIRLILTPGGADRAVIPAGRWRVTMKAGLAGRGSVLFAPREVAVPRASAWIGGMDRELEHEVWRRIKSRERERQALAGGRDADEAPQPTPPRRR